MIKIICLGKIKEKYFTDAIVEYQKRISRYNQIKIIELEDIGLNDKKVVLRREALAKIKYLRDVIDQKDYIITLEIEGNMISSEEFSRKIEEINMQNSNITFIIGGSFGLSDNIKSLSNYKLSFSKMTFPHQLFRVILLEQIYRAYKIINNEEYHK